MTAGILSEMNVLIVDNGTSYLHQLVRLMGRHAIDICVYKDIPLKKTDGYDLVILSGGHGHQVMGNESLFRPELDLIRRREKALVGICMGYELIVRAYGGTLTKLPIKERGIISLANISNSPLFYGLPNFDVYESHRWIADALPMHLIGLAQSRDGYEVIKHKRKPQIGFQFHPEMCVERTCGDEIFLNALAVVGLV